MLDQCVSDGIGEILTSQTFVSTIQIPDPATSSQSKKNTVLKSHGRPPWYGMDGMPISDAYVVGIAGGSASGKTHVARQIVKALGSVSTVVILSQDGFYRHHTPEELTLAHANRLDLDHPDALDMPLFASCLADLKACKQTNIPMYSFKEHQRLEQSKYLYGANVIIVEGIMVLTDPKMRALYDLKVFVQCDSDLRLARRIKRDVTERGRDVNGILEQYLRYVKPAYDNFYGPTSRHADIVVQSENAVAVELIATHIRRQLDDRARHFGKQMVSVSLSERLLIKDEDTENPNLILLPQTPQIMGIYTILRNKLTNRRDFIFFIDRLATFLLENAMEQLPYRSKAITTPVGKKIIGKELDAKNICGVSILRSGGPLERGLQRVINKAPIGSLLIQSDADSGEPLLLHVMLPICIRDRDLAQDSWVFLLDAQIGTAAPAFMAIRVLLDHGVRQDHIIFVTFLVAQGGGISVLRHAFPLLKVVCGAVDEGLREAWLGGCENDNQYATAKRKCWLVEPGIGHIGDRYFL